MCVCVCDHQLIDDLIAIVHEERENDKLKKNLMTVLFPTIFTHTHTAFLTDFFSFSFFKIKIYYSF